MLGLDGCFYIVEPRNISGIKSFNGKAIRTIGEKI